MKPRSRAPGRRSDLARFALICAVAVLVCSCTASGSRRPAARPPSTGVGPAVTASPPGATATTSTISLAAIQRLDSRVGFVSGWGGTGLGLAETSDAGVTWQRITIPASRITALRFIDERVGWAGAFVDRDVPQVACQQAAPAGARPCRGVVLRTSDGGRTWQETLSIVTDGWAPLREHDPGLAGADPGHRRRPGRTWRTAQHGGRRGDLALYEYPAQYQPGQRC